MSGWNRTGYGNLLRRIALAVLAGGFLFASAGCEPNDPIEDAADEAENAANSVGDAIEDVADEVENEIE